MSLKMNVSILPLLKHTGGPGQRCKISVSSKTRYTVHALKPRTPFETDVQHFMHAHKVNQIPYASGLHDRFHAGWASTLSLYVSGTLLSAQTVHPNSADQKEAILSLCLTLPVNSTTLCSFLWG